jgi:hypothetical protein
MSKQKEEDERYTCGLLCGSIKHYFLTLFRSSEESRVYVEDIVRDID